MRMEVMIKKIKKKERWRNLIEEGQILPPPAYPLPAPSYNLFISRVPFTKLHKYPLFRFLKL